MPQAVLDMMDRRPIWAMPSWVPDDIRSALPTGWELLVVDEATDGSGDGAARVSPAVLDAASRAEIYFGYGIPAELLDAAPGLRWVHSGAAGVGASLSPIMLARDVVFTNSAGVHAAPMAETVLAMVLFFGRGLDLAVANQREARWDTGPYYVSGSPLTELSSLTVGIVGFGGIGREVARRVASLGAEVIAVKRTPARATDADLTPVSGGESLREQIEILHGTSGLHEVLAKSDVLVLAAPDTSETRGMLDAEALGRMKEGALLINVARGKLVDEKVVLDALVAGRLRGVGLDVVSKEPLALDHPFWAHPRALITPHVSAVTRGFWRRETDLILHNLDRYLQGAPEAEWRNVVNKAEGY